MDRSAVLNHAVALAIGGILLACRPAGESLPITPEADLTPVQAIDREAPYWHTTFPKWEQPFEPFRLIGDIHYVGSRGLAVFFIPTEEGHILIDGGLPGQGDYIASQIEMLGYDPKDIAIILNTHAHFDHSGGFAELKALTGATLIASAADKPAIERGVYLGSEEVDDFGMPPVIVDQILEDGEVISLGGVDLTAQLTPGHSPGCTSWWITVEEGGESYDVLVFCSATVAANRLVGRPQYSGIVDDYQFTFERARDWTPDVFLSNHPEVFFMEERRERMEEEGPLVFVDQDRFPQYILNKEEAFQLALVSQTEALNIE